MKKISIVGPESSGKSTLGVYLSRVLDCSLVLEYSREYLRNKKKYSFSDLTKIAEKQNRLYTKKINERGNFIISDTCLLDIEVWSEIKFKKVDKKILKLSMDEVYDVYFLCAPDIPWQEDILRENPDEKKRKLIFKLFEKKMSNRNLNYYVVDGNLTKRLKSCLDIIHKIK